MDGGTASWGDLGDGEDFDVLEDGDGLLDAGEVLVEERDHVDVIAGDDEPGDGAGLGDGDSDGAATGGDDEAEAAIRVFAILERGADLLRADLFVGGDREAGDEANDGVGGGEGGDESGFDRDRLDRDHVGGDAGTRGDVVDGDDAEERGRAGGGRAAAGAAVAERGERQEAGDHGESRGHDQIEATARARGRALCDCFSHRIFLPCASRGRAVLPASRSLLDQRVDTGAERIEWATGPAELEVLDEGADELDVGAIRVGDVAAGVDGGDQAVAVEHFAAVDEEAGEGDDRLRPEAGGAVEFVDEHDRDEARGVRGARIGVPAAVARGEQRFRPGVASTGRLNASSRSS